MQLLGRLDQRHRTGAQVPGCWAGANWTGWRRWRASSSTSASAPCCGPITKGGGAGEAELDAGASPAVKALARQMIAAQQAEICQLHGWKDAWTRCAEPPGNGIRHAVVLAPLSDVCCSCDFGCPYPVMPRGVSTRSRWASCRQRSSKPAATINPRRRPRARAAASPTRDTQPANHRARWRPACWRDYPSVRESANLAVGGRQTSRLRRPSNGCQRCPASHPPGANERRGRGFAERDPHGFRGSNPARRRRGRSDAAASRPA